MPASEDSIRYMDRTRDYYHAIGYDKAYVWAQFDDVPFARLAGPLARTRIGLVTTAHPSDKSNHDGKGNRHVWSGAIDSQAALNTDDLAWDRESTHTEDRESYLPIKAVAALAAVGLVGGLTRRFHGAPTSYSQRKTIDVDAPEILRRLRDDGAQAVLLSAL